MRQIHQVLRPGGSFLLQDILGHDDAAPAAFILEVERRRDPSHVRALPGGGVEGLPAGGGLTVMEDAVVWQAARRGTSGRRGCG